MLYSRVIPNAKLDTLILVLRGKVNPDNIVNND